MRNLVAVVLLIQTWVITLCYGMTGNNTTDITTVPTGEGVSNTISTTVGESAESTTETNCDTTEQTTQNESTESTTESTQEEEAGATQDETIPQETPDIQEDNLVSLKNFVLTAYCSCRKCCGDYALNRPVDENGNEIVYGATGVELKAGVSVAVDPSVIPFGTKVVINGNTYIAHDTGSGVIGRHIDIYFDNHQDALNFGVQKAEVFVYD